MKTTKQFPSCSKVQEYVQKYLLTTFRRTLEDKRDDLIVQSTSCSPEDPSSAPRTLFGQLPTSCTSSSREQCHCLVSTSCHTHMAHIHRNMHVHKNKTISFKENNTLRSYIMTKRISSEKFKVVFTNAS